MWDWGLTHIYSGGRIYGRGRVVGRGRIYGSRRIYGCHRIYGGRQFTTHALLSCHEYSIKSPLIRH